MPPTLEYICDLDSETKLTIGIARKKTEEEWQICLRFLNLFESDCQKILQIFDDFWTNCSDYSEKTKATWLKEKMCQAYPDFLTNIKRQGHTTILMDWLMTKGHKIVAPANQKYIPTYAMLISDDSVEDMFDAWVADDPEAWFEAIYRKFRERESRRHEQSS